MSRGRSKRPKGGVEPGTIKAPYVRTFRAGFRIGNRSTRQVQDHVRRCDANPWKVETNGGQNM